MTNDDRPSLSEVPGAVATGVMKSLRNEPILLVIVVMNVLMIATLIWGVAHVAGGRTDLMNKLIERCTPDNRMPNALLEPPKPLPPPLSISKPGKKED
jgi:hypothetical protein